MNILTLLLLYFYIRKSLASYEHRSNLLMHYNLKRFILKEQIRIKRRILTDHSFNRFPFFLLILCNFALVIIVKMKMKDLGFQI